MNAILHEVSSSSEAEVRRFQAAPAQDILYVEDDGLRMAATLEKPFTAEPLLETVQGVLRTAGGIQKRGELCRPVLTETLAHIQPASHWGINE